MEPRNGLESVRNPLWSVAALVIVIAGLRAAAPIAVPFLVAVFLATICAPVATHLGKWRVPHIVAVLLIVLGLLALTAAAGAVLGGSINEFTENAPRYKERVTEMARSGAVLWGRLFGSRQLELSADKVLAVVDPGAVMSLVGSSMNALAQVLSDGFLVLLTMVFILIEAPTLPGKLRKFAGRPDADISHFSRIANEVQRYLAVKTVLALVTGTLVGTWCAVLGVDYALLWGLLAFLLNYIPNIGVILAAVPPLLLCLVQYGAGRTLMLVAGYTVVGMVVGNMIEPTWLGRRLGLSTLVVFLSLVIWGWIWGGVGMFLSVPLTMVVKILLESSKEWAPVAALLDGAATGRSLAAAAALGAKASAVLRPDRTTPTPLPPSNKPTSTPQPANRRTSTAPPAGNPSTAPHEDKPSSLPREDKPSSLPREAKPSSLPREDKPSSRSHEDKPSSQPRDGLPSTPPPEDEPAAHSHVPSTARLLSWSTNEDETGPDSE